MAAYDIQQILSQTAWNHFSFFFLFGKMVVLGRVKIRGKKIENLDIWKVWSSVMRTGTRGESRRISVGYRFEQIILLTLRI